MVATDSGTLTQRIRAEFDAREQRLKQTEQLRAREFEDRERRMDIFNRTCDGLKSVWTPRLQEFSRQFGERVKLTPSITPSQRAVTVNFLTELANVTLRLTVSTDPDATKLVIDYDLLIIPVYFEYERYSRLEMPLDRVDSDVIGRWFDDRLVSCVRAYLTIQDNEFYLRRTMAEDPVTHAKFLKEDAAATLDHGGRTVYFASKDSLDQYKQQHRITG